MRLKRVTSISVVVALVLALLGYRGATAEPVQRDLAVHLAGWPHGRAPVKLVLLTDLHVGEPEMPTTRLAALVARVNALRPDCVLIGGDLLSDKMVATRDVGFAEAMAPLSKLRPRIATIAVLGNHDHWRNARKARAALLANGAIVLSNDAVRCGALAIGGADDLLTKHADVPATMRAMRRIGGVPVLLSHGPDVFPSAKRVPLTLAGHTHCGQIVLPWWGALHIPSAYGRRYACGLVGEGGRVLVISAGIGTSVLPIRWGAPADFWVVTVGA